MSVMKTIKVARLTTVGATATTTTMAELHNVAPTGSHTALLIACWAVGAIAAVAAATWLIAYLVSKRAKPISNVKIAVEDDLVELRKLAVEFFGHKVTSLHVMRQWMTRRKDMFYGIKLSTRRGHTTTDELDGYFALLPLTHRAVQRLRNQRVTINDLVPVDIAVNVEKTGGIYVGAIAARSELARGTALLGLRKEINKMAAGQRKMIVMARPITDDGMRLADHFNLKPVYRAPDGTTLGVLHIGTLEPFLDED